VGLEYRSISHVYPRLFCGKEKKSSAVARFYGELQTT
jgi:hypothetical protein